MIHEVGCSAVYVLHVCTYELVLTAMKAEQATLGRGSKSPKRKDY